MEISYQYIRQLYLERLTETISEEDDAQLESLLDENSEARSIWRQLEEENSELNASFILAQIDPESELEAWKSRIGETNEPVHRPIWWRLPAAAAMVAGLAIGYYFWNNSKVVPLSANQTALTSPDSTRNKAVKLVLGNGQSYEFSKSAAQQFDAGGIALKNSGSQLLYEGNQEQQNTLNTLTVPAKEDYNITLSDGTRVSLNSESKLQFPFHFTGDIREVYIEGEAYLEVAKDSKRPFIVHTPLTDIHVTGTRFNVNTYTEGTVRTSLVEGHVSVRATDKKPLDLIPGLEATYQKQEGFTTAQFDAAEVLSWREGISYFHDRPLGELTGLISRWYGVQVVFERKELAQRTISGLLEKEHLTEFLNDLGKTSGIGYTLKDKVLYLK